MARSLRQQPSASDELADIADWVEFQAMTNSTQRFSRADLISVMRRSSTVEAVEQDPNDPRTDGVPGRTDAGSLTSQAVADDVFSTLQSRADACGEKASYPFTFDIDVLSATPGWNNQLYSFLLLQSWVPPTSGHGGTAVLFEDCATLAALGLLGGPENNAVAQRVGSPRRAPLGRMHAQVSEMCRLLGEGDGIRDGEGDHNGDGKLDLVAWRTFPDRRQGKLILFGQCACGFSTWDGKLSELDVQGFAGKFLRDRPLVWPLRLFFVPWQIPEGYWRNTVVDSGLVLDRCRLVSCIRTIDAALTARIVAATQRLLTSILPPRRQRAGRPQRPIRTQQAQRTHQAHGAQQGRRHSGRRTSAGVS